MNNNVNHPLLPDDPCMSEDQLLAYLDDRLTPLQRHEAEKHMLDCGFCSDALEGMALVAEHRRAAVIIPLQQKTTTEVPAQAEKEKSEAKVIYLRPRFWMATAASITLLLGTLWVLNNGPQSSHPNGMAQVTAMNETPSSDSKNSNAKTDTNAPRTSDRIITLHDTVHLNPAPAPVENYDGVKNVTVYKDQVSGATTSVVANGGTFSYRSDSLRTVPVEAEKENATLAKADASAGIASESTSFDAITNDSDESFKATPQSAGRKEERDSKNKRHDTQSKTATSPNDYYSKSDIAKPANDDKYRSVTDTTTIALQKKTDAEKLLKETTQTATVNNISTSSTSPTANGSTSSGTFSSPRNTEGITTGEAYSTGLSYLQQKQYTNAIAQFDQVLTNKANAHYEDARWQKAKALAAAGRKAEAKALLQSIANDSAKYKTEAAEELKKY